MQGAGSYTYYRLYVTKTNTASNSLALREMDFFGAAGIVRSLIGGVTWADAAGNANTTADQGLGAFPTTNEWDTYIVKSNLGGKASPGADNVWNWSQAYTWVQDTPHSTVAVGSNRIARGKDTSSAVVNNVSSTATAAYGFRPVFEYAE
jgi:hypothetical protein